jgi:hypothetical protein
VGEGEREVGFLVKETWFVRGVRHGGEELSSDSLGLSA